MTSAAILGSIRSFIRGAINAPLSLTVRLRRPFTLMRLKRYDKLHLGSGDRIIKGWANIDIAGFRTIPWDLRNPLPLASGQVRLVYTEHFIEHIDRDAACRMLRGVRGAMADGAIIRLSTPNLAKLVSDYQAGRVIQMDRGGWFPKTPCQMVNEGMRLWGHAFVYDEPELLMLFAECGFSDVRRVKWGESKHPELRSLESRPDFDDLIVEASA